MFQNAQRGDYEPSGRERRREEGGREGEDPESQIQELLSTVTSTSGFLNLAVPAIAMNCNLGSNSYQSVKGYQFRGGKFKPWTQRVQFGAGFSLQTPLGVSWVIHMEASVFVVSAD